MGLKRKLGNFWEPQIVKAGFEEDLEKRKNHIALLKADGTECIVERNGEGLTLYGRRGLEYTLTLPDVVASFQKIKAYYRIIGELCYIDDKGHMVFTGSQKRCQISNPKKVEEYSKAYPLILFVFDIVNLNGENLENIPFYQRRQILTHFIGLQKALNYHELDNIRLMPMKPSNMTNREFYQSVVGKGYEGVVLYNLLGTYQSGKETDDILKIKCRDHSIYILSNDGVI